MLQLIGLMVGSYVCLRCVSFASRTGDRAETKMVQFFSALCFLLNFLLTFALLASSGSGSHG